MAELGRTYIKSKIDALLALKASTTHKTSHEPGGSDALAVDAAAATGSLRSLGTGATQAAAGNDARLSDQRVPADLSVTDGKVAAANKDGAAATASMRTLGTGATQAAAGNDSRFGAVKPAASIDLATANTAAANRAALLTLAGSTDHIAIPAGDYLIDNATLLSIVSFNGRLTFAPGARFVFTDNTKRGVVFSEGTQVVDGWSSTYQTTPTTRQNSQAPLDFSLTVDSRVWGPYIDGSPNVGIAFVECIRPHCIKPVVKNTLADGIYAVNCEDYRLIDPTTYNTADDGVSFHSYGMKPDYYRGEIRGVTVRNSDARGIAVMGQRDVTITINLIENTNHAGVLVGTDATVSSRVPRNVQVSGGVIRNAGAYDDTTNEQPRATVTNHGLMVATSVSAWAASTAYALNAVRRPTTSNGHIYMATTAGTSDATEPTWPLTSGGTVVDGSVTWTEIGSDECSVSFSNITIETPNLKGVQTNVEKGEVRFEDVHVKDALSRGFEVYSQRAYLDNCSASETNDTGFYFYDVAELHYSGLLARNTSKTNANKRAIEVIVDGSSRFTNHRVLGGEVRIRDSQATPTGYSVYVPAAAGGKTLHGTLGHLSWDLDTALTTTPEPLQNLHGIGWIQGSIRQGGVYSVQNAAPASGYWSRQMRVRTGNPTVGQTAEWECVTAGAPGTWQPRTILGQTYQISANRGDASVTLGATEAPVQRFATDLTANRTVTLPTGYANAYFEIVRTGLGAFTLDVGGLKTIPASTAAVVKVMHDGTAWRLIGYGLL